MRLRSSPPSVGRRLRAFAAAALLVGALPVLASAQDETRIAAVVNTEVISALDLENRLNMVIVTSGLPNTQEERQRISVQVLRNLIDERLQLQEAKRLSISVSDQEIADAIKQIEQSNNMEPGTFDAVLQRSRVDKESIVQQLRATLSWNKVVRQQLSSTVSVGEDEVDEIVTNLQRSQNIPQYRISEILLSVDDPKREDEVRQTAEKLVDQIRTGANFGAVARQFSAAASAGIGGDVGWILENQIEPALVDTVRALKDGEISRPIRTVTGYQIVQRHEMRSISGAESDSGESVVRLKQVLLPLDSDSTPATVEAKNKEAETIASQAKACDDMDRLAEAAKSPAPSALGRYKLNELSPALRAVVGQLKPGQPSGPVRMPGGVAVLMVCERSDVASSGPSRDDVRDQIFRGKMSVIMRRYMRDLRRAAFLDVRI